MLMLHSGSEAGIQFEVLLHRNKGKKKESKIKTEQRRDRKQWRCTVLIIHRSMSTRLLSVYSCFLLQSKDMHLGDGYSNSL